MSIIGVALSILGLGAMCWLLFSLAIYALPFCVGMTIAFAALHRGSGIVPAFAVGVFAAGTTLTLGRVAFAAARPPLIRAAVGLLFAIPAALAGYHLPHGLAGSSMTDEGSCAVIALVGAGLIGATAFSRMAWLPRPADPGYSGSIGLLAFVVAAARADEGVALAMRSFERVGKDRRGEARA